jgi:hypothetical protein
MASNRQLIKLADSPINMIIFLIMVIVALFISLLEGDRAKSLQNSRSNNYGPSGSTSVRSAAELPSG